VSDSFRDLRELRSERFCLAGEKSLNRKVREERQENNQNFSRLAGSLSALSG